MVLDAPTAMCLYVGPDFVMLYNDAYRRVLGAKHPTAFARPAAEVWREIWATIGPQFATLRASGAGLDLRDVPFTIERLDGGGAEEAWFDYTLTPVRGTAGFAGTQADAGRIAGILALVTETTARVHGERALATERERLASVLAAMGDAHIALDREWRVVAMNPAAERVNGRPAAHFLGRSHWDAWPESVGTEIERQYRRAMTSRLPVQFETHYAEQGVMDVWVEIDAVPTADGGLGLFCRDVTARHVAAIANDKLLTEAQAERARAEAILEVMADAHFVLDADFCFVSANPAMERNVGLTREQLRGRCIWDLFPGTPGTIFEASYRRVANERVHVHFIGEYDENGLSLVPEVDAYPAPGGGVAVFWRDIGQRLRADREREALLAEAEAAKRAAEQERERAMEANRAKADFLTVMSHELRTPLNAIAGYTQLVQLGLRGPVTPEQHADLEKIQRSQHHLLGLINGVLNYAKLEAGAVEYRVEEVDVEAVLRACEALIAPQVDAKGLTLEHSPQTRGLRVQADAEKLQQVLLNLLTNAVKFTPAGGRIVLHGEEVAVETGDDAPRPRVAIAVTDTGIGIAADKTARVFEPFVQIDARLTRVQDGTGLGLSISRDLARGMGGEITVDTAPGAGSTFRVTLPAVPVPERRATG